MRFLSLFAGIGAFDLGLELAGWQCAGQCEIDPFCRAVLAKHWPDVPRFDDVRTLTADMVVEHCGFVDAIVGGFPCQDASVAGKGAGIDGERTGLWRDYARLIRGLRPLVVCAENVPGLIARGLDRVVSDLERARYRVEVFNLGADDVGAPHRRKRIWIVGRLADANRSRHESRGLHAGQRKSRDTAPVIVGTSENRLANAERRGRVGGTPEPRRGTIERTSIGGTGEGMDTAGPTDMADATGGGFRANRSACGNAGHIDERGETMADAPGRGRKEFRIEGNRDILPAIETHGADIDERRPAIRWPSRPGEPQHDWEPPRVVRFERGMGCRVDGATADVLQAIRGQTGWDDARAQEWYAKNRVRLERFQNRNALRCLGNAVVWLIPFVLARAIAAAEPHFCKEPSL